MAFKLTHHDDKFFHAEGGKGPFRIAKKGLTKAQHDRYVAMCDGGVVPKKMADGGEVSPELRASGKNALLDVARIPAEMGYPLVPNAAIAGIRSVVRGTPYADEKDRLDEYDKQRRLDRTSSVVDTADSLPGETLQQSLKRQLADPVAIQNAIDQAAMYMGAGPESKPPVAAKAITAAEEAAAAARTRGATTGATEARLGMTGGSTAAEAARDALSARGGTVDPAVMAAAREKIAAAAGRGGRTGVGLVPWDTMSLPEAQAAARDRAHLFQLDGGQYVGAAPGMNSPQKLAALRAKIDSLVEKGAKLGGSDWYERARGAIREIANGDPQMERQLSEVLAIYSPQATPDTNFGWAMQQANRTALEGADSSRLPGNWPKTRLQAEKAANTLSNVPQDLGPKAGVYEQHINPNKAEEAQVRGVNDLWQGKIFGYPPGKDKSVGSGLASKAGFSDAQHSFMTGENLQAAERAAGKGLLPAGVEPNVGNVQSSTWVAQRYDKLVKDQNARVAAAKKNGTKPKIVPDEELRRRAAQSYDTVLDKYTGNETYETVPGRGVKGHLEGIQDLPMADRAAYTEATTWSPQDEFYKAMGMPSRPTQAGLGQFGEDFNPNRTAKPMVSYTSGKTQKATGSKGINAPEQKMIEQANLVRSVIDAQDAGAWNAPRMSGGGNNAARVRFPHPLDEAATRKLYGQAKAAGVDLIDTGGGTFVPNGSFGEMSAKDFGKRMRGGKEGPGMGDALAGARVDPATYVGGYQSIPWGPEGSGQVTEHLLKNLDPRVAAKLDASPAWRGKVGEKIVNDMEQSRKLGVGDPRADIQKLRGLISTEGLEGLRQFVINNGPKGLPAIMLPMLQEAFGQDLSGKKEEPQHHAAGGEVQHFDGGGAVQPAPPVDPSTLMSVQPPAAPQATFGPSVVPDPFAAPTPGPYVPEQRNLPASNLPGGQDSADPYYQQWLLNRAADRQAQADRASAKAGMAGVYDPDTGALLAPASPSYAPPGAPGGYVPPEQQAGPGGPPAPVQQPSAVDPRMPQVPQVQNWGTGAPQEIAAASKAYGVAAGEKAVKEEAALQRMADVQAQTANATQMLATQRQQRYDERTKVADAMYEEIKSGKIDPNHFFSEGGVTQKIMAGIGMLLSGAGAGITGQPNMAMDVINRAIDRDVDSQKFNLQNKKSLYQYYVQRTGDELVATNYLKADLLDVAAAKIEGMKLGLNAATVGPIAQMAVQQFRMQAAQARQDASLKEIEGAAKSYELRMAQYKMQLLQQMVGAQPGAVANGGDNTQFLRNAARIGVVPEANIGHEVLEEPVLDPRTRQPVIDRSTGQPEVQSRVVWRLYPDPLRAQEADGVFQAAAVLRPSLRAAAGIIASHPTGSVLLQDPQALAQLRTHIAAIKIMYERGVGAVNRQPNEATLNELDKALGTPGGITDAVLGSSLASLSTIEMQLADRQRAMRAGAHY